MYGLVGGVRSSARSERWPLKPLAEGSNPSGPAIFFRSLGWFLGSFWGYIWFYLFPCLAVCGYFRLRFKFIVSFYLSGEIGRYGGSGAAIMGVLVGGGPMSCDQKVEIPCVACEHEYFSLDLARANSVIKIDFFHARASYATLSRGWIVG